MEIFGTYYDQTDRCVNDPGKQYMLSVEPEGADTVVPLSVAS